jgi:hypothetical protein
MRRAFFFFSLLLLSFAGLAQFDPNCESGTSAVFTVDSVYFESTSNYGKIIIDFTFPGNLWQVGGVQKAGFPSALSGTNALQTDTLNNYPVGNESAAILYLDTSFGLMTLGLKSFSF